MVVRLDAELDRLACARCKPPRVPSSIRCHIKEHIFSTFRGPTDGTISRVSLRPAATEIPSLPPPPSGVDRAFWIAFAACAVVASLAVWGHRFPAGIDLAQHAQLFQMLTNYWKPELGYRHFFSLQVLTPYLGTYLLAVPFTAVGGPVFAAKMLVWIVAMATPYALLRWLRALGGEAWWSLFGFLLAFGFGYQWGFATFQLACPVALLYLASVETNVASPTLRNGVQSAALLALLFFFHGIVFAVVAFASGVRCLFGPGCSLAGVRRTLRHWLTLLPAALITLAWLVTSQDHPEHAIEWPPSPARIGWLFSGWWSATPSFFPAVAALGWLLALAWMARPVAADAPKHWVPLLVAALGVALVPEWLFGTWLVGGRIVALVHLFAPAAFLVSARGRRLVVMRWACAVFVLAGLTLLNRRLYLFDEETRGLYEIAEHVPVGASLRGIVEETESWSEAFGPKQHAQAAAWIAALRSGYLENDSAKSFQVPIRRRNSEGWFSHYEWLLARSGGKDVLTVARHFESSTEEVFREGQWVLLRSQARPTAIGDIEVVRFTQQLGELQLGGWDEGAPLTMGGRVFTTGFGVRPISKVQLHLASQARALEGTFGIDDRAVPGTGARFEILDGFGKILLDGGTVTAGNPPKEFSIDLGGRRDLLLQVLPGPSTGGYHPLAEWVDLRAVK